MVRRAKPRKKAVKPKRKPKPGLVQRGLARRKWVGRKLVAKKKKAKPRRKLAVDEAYRQLYRIKKVAELTAAHADLLRLMRQMNELLVSVKQAKAGQAKALEDIQRQKHEIAELAKVLAGKSNPIALAWKVELTRDLMNLLGKALTAKYAQKELAELETYLIQNLREMSAVSKRARKITSL